MDLTALAVYAESLAVGRQVAIFGDATLGLARKLADLGARSVHLWDPDPERARRAAEQAPHGISVHPYPPGDRDARDGAFDLAIVTDLRPFDSAEALMARIRDLVGERGVALVLAANGGAVPHGGPGSLDYYELFDLVAREFDEVRMVAQLRFEGVAFAELGDEDESPSVSVDTQLADGRSPPDAFVAVGSQREARLDPYAIIELASLPPVGDDQQEPAAARVDLEEMRLRAEAVDRELVDLRRQASRLPELEQAAREQAEARRLEASQMEQLARRAERAEQAASALGPDLERVQEAHTVELTRLEDALRERARAVRLLEAEVERRARMVHELVETLDDAPANPSEEDGLAEENAQLRHKLDVLALELARREADAQAAAWAVAEPRTSPEADKGR